MRMSCNGCRVLRKGCGDDCVIRPCLQWIRSPDGQANATVFLAKFYGRAGLINLIAAGPQHLRPAIFRSLLYEACGRIVNPIYGSVGLLWSGRWQQCQATVDAVLRGAAIPQSTAGTAAAPPLKIYDIRHVTKNRHAGTELHKVDTKSRAQFKRPGAEPVEVWVEPSRESVSQEYDSEFSAETTTNSHISHAELSRKIGDGVEERDMGLELTLGPLGLLPAAGPVEEIRSDADESRSDTCPANAMPTTPA
ncbi:LOB domain-containing protein 42-like [Typha latifolia]|uniref:LOB domain-containing protein 42-like n=1 Tax=Typha latifolia TaxID=4733 RepID=UPI003C2E6ED3